MNAPKAISLKTKLRVVLSLTALILLSGLSVRVDAATTSYTYDALNRLTQTTYPNGSVISVYLRFERAIGSSRVLPGLNRQRRLRQLHRAITLTPCQSRPLEVELGLSQPTLQVPLILLEQLSL